MTRLQANHKNKLLLRDKKLLFFFSGQCRFFKRVQAFRYVRLLFSIGKIAQRIAERNIFYDTDDVVFIIGVFAVFDPRTDKIA